MAMLVTELGTPRTQTGVKKLCGLGANKVSGASDIPKWKSTWVLDGQT